jgi:putative redox protein
MTDETLRRVDLTRLSRARYTATNAAGATITVGEGDDSFSPVELLLAAIAGCSAADVDYITAKRSEPERFEVTMTGHKIRDEQGNRLVDLRLAFDVVFPDDDAGRAAREVLPRSVQQSHDRLCTVSRTVEVGTPIEAVVD